MRGQCQVCGKWADLDCHHVFGGANRPKSERYGLKVYICRDCHNLIHFGRGRKLTDRLRREFQLKFEREHPGLDFAKLFHVNYLGEEDRKQEDEGLDLNDLK